jgi:hypothetical protein
VAGDHVEVGGAPFFPVMLIDQCTPADAARAGALGVNLIINESCPDVDSAAQLGAISPYSLAVLPIANRLTRGRALAGWAFPDEPENNGWTPQRLRNAYPYRRGSADGLLSFVTTGAGFYRSPQTSSTIDPHVYRRFARLADVAGFDLYPLGHCTTDLALVYDAQRAFNTLVGAMPTFQWIETGPIRAHYCGGFEMSAGELNAEVWLAIAGGARGIGYFTHTWNPDHRSFDVRPDILRQMVRTNALVAAARPALVGTTVPSSVNSGAVKVLARRAGNATYVIGVNTARTGIRVKYDVPALRDGNARVLGEHRFVSVSHGQLDDGFGPLGVHIYVQPARGG